MEYRHIGPRSHNSRLLQRMGMGGYGARQQIIVGVHEDHDRSATHPKAEIGGGDHSPVPLERGREPAGVGLDNRPRIVARAVIHHNHVHGRIVLPEDAFDALL